MKFMLLIYNDSELLGALSQSTFDSEMRGCLANADQLRAEGRLIDSQMLEDPGTAKSLRIRNGKRGIVDGPFAESKEVLGGFNLIEADSMEEALEIAEHFPWARTGCVEVRPVRDIASVRERVGAPAGTAARA